MLSFNSGFSFSEPKIWCSTPQRDMARAMRLFTSCCCVPSAAKIDLRYLNFTTFFSSAHSTWGLLFCASAILLSRTFASAHVPVKFCCMGAFMVTLAFMDFDSPVGFAIHMHCSVGSESPPASCCRRAHSESNSFSLPPAAGYHDGVPTCRLLHQSSSSGPGICIYSCLQGHTVSLFFTSRRSVSTYTCLRDILLRVRCETPY